MDNPPRKQRAYIRGRLPNDPRLQRYYQWLPANRGFYASFREWLNESGYGSSALSLYSVAARYALAFLQKPYWTIDPDQDLPSVLDFLQSFPLSQATYQSYRKGVMKLGDFLRLRLRKPPVEKNLNWGRCLQGLPDWLQVAVRDYLAFCRAKWPVERRHKLSSSRLSHLTLSLRWMCSHTELKSPGDITPAIWFQYVDDCLAKGKSAYTVNSHQATLQAFVHFLDDNGVAVCERFFLVDYLKVGPTIPKDASIHQLRKVFLAIERETLSSHAWCRRCATMDRAWFLLMLHCGLRTGEVRRLRWCECDLDRRQIRIEQSKGLKDRVVFLSPAVVSALEAYREVRGPQDCLPEQVFIFRHAPMSVSYAYERLQHYGSVCGVTLTPHQLRHSCATLLLNAGAPVVSVRAILGHKYIDTTLNYARLYDGTLAADYYRAMNEVERLLALVEQPDRPAPSPGELIALVDALRRGTLNENQVEVVQALRDGIMALARKEQSENAMEDVKVLALAE